MQNIICGYLTPSRIKVYHKDPKKFFDEYVGDLTDATTSWLVDPTTFRLIEPTTGLQVDPATGLLIDTEKHELVFLPDGTAVDAALRSPNLSNVKRIQHPEKWATSGIWLLQGTAAHAAAQYGRMKMMEGMQFTLEEVMDAALAGYYHAIAETFPGEQGETTTSAYLVDLLARRGQEDLATQRPGLLTAWEYLEQANTNIKKDPFEPKRTKKSRPTVITFGSDPIQSLEQGEAAVRVMVTSIVNRLLPTEVLTLKPNGEVKRDLRIVSVERKVNYTGYLGFNFYGRTDTKAADGTIKDLKTSFGEIDFWMIFQLLCYGLPDYLSDPQNPKLDPIQIDQLVKDEDMSIHVFPFQPTKADYEATHQLILQTCDQIQLMQAMPSYDEDEFQSLLADYRQALYLPLEADYDPAATSSPEDGFGPLLEGNDGIALKVKRGFKSILPRLTKAAILAAAAAPEEPLLTPYEPTSLPEAAEVNDLEFELI